MSKNPSSPKVVYRSVEHLRQVFNQYASVERDGIRYMNKADFLAVIAPGEDFDKIKPAASEQDLITLNDFVISQNLLAKPDAEYNTHKITFDQFKQVLSSNLPDDTIPFDFDCDWLKLANDRDSSSMINNKRADQLKQTILAIAQHKLSDVVIDHLPIVCNLYATGITINFSNMVVFYNVIRNIARVELVIRHAIAASPEKTMTKQDFLNLAAQSSRSSLATYHFTAATTIE
ncbi:hypothetical protein BC941DRAFT_470823 [Chlamydoabsidia padenii]|nr:hypothetical protein BC941DRAFT_470823 [Chlamydoabsidia padenii]